jgi:hypothetical protein
VLLRLPGDAEYEVRRRPGELRTGAFEDHRLVESAEQLNAFVACGALRLPDGAGHAAGDHGEDGRMGPRRHSVSDHEAWDVARGASVAPAASPSFLSNEVAHDHGTDVLRRIVKDGPVLVGCCGANQSRSIPAPSLNGFSRLSFGPVTYPSTETDMSLITSATGWSS